MLRGNRRRLTRYSRDKNFRNSWKSTTDEKKPLAPPLSNVTMVEPDAGVKTVSLRRSRLVQCHHYQRRELPGRVYGRRTHVISAPRHIIIQNVRRIEEKDRRLAEPSVEGPRRQTYLRTWSGCFRRS